jgi:hypothetical protein
LFDFYERQNAKLELHATHLDGKFHVLIHWVVSATAACSASSIICHFQMLAIDATTTRRKGKE